MKSLGLFETKNRLSEICEQVAQTAEPVVVTRHGKPLVRIVPFAGPDGLDSVWSTVKESRARYGPIKAEFDLPERENSANRVDPLSEPPAKG